MRHLTASSMNFERSPCFFPRWARKLRTEMSVSFETETVQRVVVLLDMTPPDKRIFADEISFCLVLYPDHPRSRKSLGEIIRKLSVTESQSSAHLLGTSSRRKTRVASANSPRVW